MLQICEGRLEGVGVGILLGIRYYGYLGIMLSLFCCRGEEIRYCTDKERAANLKGVIAFREGMRAEAVNLIKSLTDV